MPGLLAALVAGCPKTCSFSVYDRCKALYDRRSSSADRAQLATRTLDKKNRQFLAKRSEAWYCFSENTQAWPEPTRERGFGANDGERLGNGAANH
jgi:hypothetical protein